MEHPLPVIPGGVVAELDKGDDVALAGHCAAGQTPGQDLGQGRYVRRHPVAGLSTPWRDSEARHHLVEDEDGVVPRRHVPQLTDKGGRQRQCAPRGARRLQDHGRHAALREPALDLRDVPLG